MIGVKKRLKKLESISHNSNHQSRAFSENKLCKLIWEEEGRKHTLTGGQTKDSNFLEERKESQLNSMFKVRRHKLNEITRANLAIYGKINSQESHYGERFHTRIEETSQSRELNTLTEQTSKFRTIMGPINNFQALALPQELSHLDLPSTRNAKKKLTPPQNLNLRKYSRMNAVLPFYTFE